MRFVEADPPRDRLDERREAAGDERRPGAGRAHRRDQHARPRRQRDPTRQHLGDDLDRKALQQRDPLAKRRREGDFAPHGALGDRGHLVAQADFGGQFVDALLLDHGGIHVGEEQFLAAGPRRDGVDIDRPAGERPPHRLASRRGVALKRDLAGFAGR